MTEARKSMINAFKLYYSGNNSDNNTVTDKELEAVKNCLFLLKRIKNGADILKAVEDVYIKADARGGNVLSRVRRLALELYTSDKQIYRYLKKAENMYIRELEMIS